MKLTDLRLTLAFVSAKKASRARSQASFFVAAYRDDGFF